MKVAILSKSDASGGGASGMAQRLAGQLQDAGVAVDHWIPDAASIAREGLRSLSGSGARNLAWKACRGASRLLGYPDMYTPEPLWITRPGWLDGYDLVHLHDTSRTLSPFSIARIAAATPVIWTLHDCSAFTAGCLYPQGCDYFHGDCHDCHQLGVWPQRTPFDRTRAIHRKKRDLYATQNIHTVAPSHWMAEQANLSNVFPRRTVVIPNGVNTGVFRPHPDRAALRRLSGIDEQAFVVLLTAQSLATPRKGIDKAINLLEGWQRPHHLVLIGTENSSLRTRLSGVSHTFTGYIDNPQAMSEWYSLGDVFLFTSTADNLPTTILESMACGTPVIASAVGGVPDMVRHTENGWLSGASDLQGLEQGLELAATDQQALDTWSTAARRTIEDSFTEQRCMERYRTLYRQAVTAFHGN